MKRKIVIAAGMMFLLIGCATTTSGTKVDENKLGQIRNGITTEKEVIELLGQPDSKGIMPDGETVLAYTYVKGKPRIATFIPVVQLFASGVEGELQVVAVTIDKNSRVSDIKVTKTTTSSDSGIFSSPREANQK